MICVEGDVIEFSCSPMEIQGVFGGDMVSYYIEQYIFTDIKRNL